MNLNDRDILKIIENSKSELSKKTKYESKVSLICGGCALLLYPFLIVLKPVLLGMVLCGFGRPIYECLKCGLKRLYGNIELEKIVRELENNGVQTTRLKLQKANVYVAQDYKKDEVIGRYGLETIKTTFFEDRKGLLKALRQTKWEMLQSEDSKEFTHQSPRNSSLPEFFVRTEVFVINDNEKVKQLLLNQKNVEK